MARTRALRSGILGAIALVALALAAAAWSAFGFLNRPPGAGDERIVFVKQGASLSAISTELEKLGVVSDAWKFSAYARLRGDAGRIKAGEYAMRTDMLPGEILHKLTSGDVVIHSVTIPEGYNLRQICALFEQKGIAPAERTWALLNDPGFKSGLGAEAGSLEGSLFPDTYRYQRGDGPEKLIRAMAARMDEVYTPQMAARAAELGLSKLEVLTLASLIEKETGLVQERPLISAVFHNRIKKGIPLACDPAVIYGTPDFSGNLRRKDLENSDNPYNTYKHRGLPPGPIANPGLDSIKAALYPADVPYLYFVSRNDGSHFFSSTLAEHNRAVQQYQRAGARRDPR